MRIFLVRHGESVANVDKSVHFTVPDHAIGLSERGVKQAERAGNFLGNYIEDNIKAKFDIRFNLSVWVSPYKRTRQTADEIVKGFDYIHWSFGPKVRRQEHINLVEQQFGLFDGLEDDQLAAKYPAEHQHYKKCEDFEGKFWARMPLGESRFDVAVRVHQFFGTIQRDNDKYGRDNVIIVGHGVTLRAFVMQWLHLPFEWFEAEPNPKNCSIRMIDGGKDMGYIYPGE